MDGNCDGDATCYMMTGVVTFPGGYCSESCCEPAEATCAGGFGVGYCAKTCMNDADCRVSEGYTCGSLGLPGGGDGPMYCLPPTGAGWMSDGSFAGDGGFPGF